MQAYNKLWQDVIEGLKKQGYTDVGGNDSCFLIMRNPEGKTVKVFLRDYDNTNENDMNHVVVRFS